MIADEEARKAVEILVKYCSERKSCKDCPFYREPDCVLNGPVVWGL